VLAMVARNLKAILVIGSILFCLVSCGYHFSGEGLGPKPGLRYIAIPVFENKTSEPDAGAIFAGALRQEFMQRGCMKVVPVEEAEAVFKATIKEIDIQSVAHHSASVVENRITLENRLFVILDIRCEEKGSHKVLWADRAFRYFKVYQVEDNPLQPNPIVGFENRQAAVGYLAQQMSTRIHDRFLSNF
jgi:pyridoxine/pyridoxamine 5'-phosphate oxidase